MANMNLPMSDPVIDWKLVAAALYPAARTAGCTCDYERTSTGVPMWFPIEGGGIGRKLIKRCARCKAIEMHELAVIAEGM